MNSVLKTDFCFIHETNTFILRGPLTILSAQCIVGSSANVNIFFFFHVWQIYNARGRQPFYYSETAVAYTCTVNVMCV